ncbi:hypothetical protein BU14_3116s0001, partial [Porphyra umbilicalis]
PRRRRRRSSTPAADGADGDGAAAAAAAASAPAAAPADAPVCALCGLAGDQLGCEGRLLTAADMVDGGGVTVHMNCALFSVEVFEADTPERRLLKVPDAVRRGRKMRCAACGRPGATVACQMGGTLCCRNHHFRCALLAGGVFLRSRTFLCPAHSRGDEHGEALPHAHHKNALFVTPVPPDELASPGCVACASGRFDDTVGPLLRCAVCRVATHSVCTVPPIPEEQMPAVAVRAAFGYYRCAGCTTCAVCDRVAPPRSGAAPAGGGGGVGGGGSGGGGSVVPRLRPPPLVVVEQPDAPVGGGPPVGGAPSATVGEVNPVFYESDDPGIAIVAEACDVVGINLASSSSEVSGA